MEKEFIVDKFPERTSVKECRKLLKNWSERELTTGAPGSGESRFGAKIEQKHSFVWVGSRIKKTPFLKGE